MTIDVTAYEERVARFRWQVPADFDFARDVIDAWAEDRGRLAAVWPEPSGGEGRATFWDLRDRSRALATVLADRGVVAGHRVAVVLPVGIDWAIANLAVLRAGAIACPIDPGCSVIDMRQRLDQLGASAVIDQSGAAIVSGQEVDARAARATVPSSAADPAVAFATSASAVSFSRGWLYAQRHTAEFWLDLRRTDLFWPIVPPDDALGIAVALFAPWSVGAPVLFASGRPDPALLSRYPVSVLCATASFYEETALPRPFRLVALRHCAVSGSVRAQTAEVWRRATGLALHVGWGRPQCPLLTAHLRGVPVRAGSIGRAFPGHEIRVVGADGREAAEGAFGELVLRGAPPTVGRSVQDAVGVDFPSGVRVRRDAQGDLWLEGSDPAATLRG